MHLASWRYKPELDALIDQGQSLFEMKDQLSSQGKLITCEGARLYIVVSGQHNYWKGKREERKQQSGELLQSRIQFLSLLEARIAQLATTKGFAYEKAWEYVKQRKISSGKDLIPFKTVVRLFDDYKYAADREVQLSYAELSEGLNIDPMSTLRILSAVGLPSLYWNCKSYPHRYYQEKRAVLKQARNLPLSIPDLEYFLQISNQFITVVFKEMKVKRPKRIIKQFGFGQSKSNLTYRLASQIYEAQDAGFTPADTVQLLDSNPIVIKYALEHRPQLEQTILGALKLFYPQENLTTPYRNSPA